MTTEPSPSLIRDIERRTRPALLPVVNLRDEVDALSDIVWQLLVYRVKHGGPVTILTVPASYNEAKLARFFGSRAVLVGAGTWTVRP